MSKRPSAKYNKSNRPAPGLIRVTRIPPLPRRPRDAHKGTFGRVLVIGGSREMIGAPALAASATLRSGAGLVTVACPASIQQAVATLCPCATTLPLPETGGGLIDPVGAMEVLSARGFDRRESGPSVLAAGPGLGSSDTGFARAWVDFIGSLDRTLCMPIVLDADGLNAVSLACPPLEGRINWPFSARFVMTPHPGEMGRLCGRTTADVQGDRAHCAVSAANDLSMLGAGTAADVFLKETRFPRDSVKEKAVVVLKGAGTLVTDGLRDYVNRSGNPGMATGGAGDVLTGVISGLIAQGLSRFDAAVLGVFVHGKAGDLAAKALGEPCVMATDLLEFLPAALSGVSRVASSARR